MGLRTLWGECASIIVGALVGEFISRSTATSTDPFLTLWWAIGVGIAWLLVDGLVLGGWILGKGKRQRRERALADTASTDEGSEAPQPPVKRGVYTGFMIRSGARDINLFGNVASGGDVGFDISGEGHTLNGNRAIK